MSQLRPLKHLESSLNWLCDQTCSWEQLQGCMAALEVLTVRGVTLVSMSTYEMAVPWLRELSIVQCGIDGGDTAALCDFLRQLRTATSIRFSKMEGCADTEQIFESISHLGGTLRQLSFAESGIVRSHHTFECQPPLHVI